MNFLGLERAFTRALYYSFSKRRLILTFPTLIFSGVCSIFCRALSINANPWISNALGFLPFFIVSGAFLVLGVLLAKIYPKDIARAKVNVKRLISSSMDLFIGVSYVAVPPLLIYILLWIVLGFFLLLKEIPGVGEFFSVIFSFAPFLIIFTSLILCVANLTILFFVTPAVNLLSVRKGSWIKKILSFLKNRIFLATLLFAIGSFPLLITFVLLLLAAYLTTSCFFVGTSSIALTFKWFFMMVPFAAILSPAVVFFFNFSSESHILMQETK